MKCITRNILIVLSLLCFSSATVVAATELLSENFNDCKLPDGWSLENLGGACDWEFYVDQENNTRQDNDTCFALASAANVYSCNDNVAMHTAFATPAVDCTGMVRTVLSFNYDVYTSSTDTVFAVEISTDSGTSWSAPVWQRGQGIDDLGPKTAEVDISAIADGQADVIVRFRYEATDAENWGWQVDDVAISADKQFNWLLFLPAITAQKTP
jgi:hypothetical protein